jgi:hypothetical protein
LIGRLTGHCAAARPGAARVRDLRLALSATGLPIGLVAAFAASRLLTTLLFDITPTDAVTYAATITSQPM